MAVSVIQVSKVAGVSKSTVSRVLNDDPRVSPETVRVVQSAIRSLGYSRPEKMGRPRRDRNGATRGSVALLFPDTQPQAMKTALSGRLTHGIEDVFRRRGLALIVSALPAPNVLPPVIDKRLVDGVIVRGTYLAEEFDAVKAWLSKCPVVYIFEPKSRVPSNWDVVSEDNDAIAGVAFDYLKSQGARRLAVVNSLAEHPSLAHRVSAFVSLAREEFGQAQLAEADVAVDVLVGRLFDGKRGSERPDGLFVPGSDTQVAAVYRALTARKIVPGKDVLLISCQDDPTRFNLVDPDAAYIDINAEAIGKAAAETLLWRLLNPKEPQRRLNVAPLLVTKGSQSQG